MSERLPKVVFICPIFAMYPQIISSLICQTHKNWDLILTHNGPDSGDLKRIVASYSEPRVHFSEFPIETGKYGHPIRRWTLTELAEGRLVPDADFVVVTNADNYHTPTFTEALLGGFKKRPDAVATYCSHMTHSYLSWSAMECRITRGYIDCAGVMMRKEVACNVGWSSLEHSSDWTYFSDVLAKYGGEKRWEKVGGCLLVHN